MIHSQATVIKRDVGAVPAQLSDASVEAQEHESIESSSGYIEAESSHGYKENTAGCWHDVIDDVPQVIDVRIGMPAAGDERPEQVRSIAGRLVG